MSSEEIDVQTAPDVAELEAEIERLKAENEALAATSTKSHDGRVRNGWAIFIVIVAALVLALAPAAIWMRNVVFDTETWVATVGPLADDPAIQNAVAKAASDALIERLDAEKRIADLLPDQYGLDRFAPILANSLESTIRTQATAVVRSEQFSEIWTEINRKSHAALLAAITGRQGEVATIEAGTLTLDTGALVDKVKERLVARGLGFVANVPTSALDREIVLFQSEALAQAGIWVKGIETLAYLIPLLGIALAVAAFGLAENRQKIAFYFGIALTIFGILPLQFLYLAQVSAGNTAQRLAGIPTSAGQAAFEIIFRDLVNANRTFIALGVAVLVGALIAGPAKWAVALRGASSGGLGTLASHLELGAFGVWVAGHKKGLRATGFAVAALVLVLLPAPRTIAMVIWLGVGLLVWVAAVEFFGAAPAQAVDAVIAEDDWTADAGEAVDEADVDSTHVAEEVTATAPQEPDNEAV